MDLKAVLKPPGAAGWLGTDDIGRDVLSRLLHAGRASLLLGVGVAVTSVGLGGVLGALAGASCWADAVVSAIGDALLSVPSLALAMVAAALLQLTPLKLILVLSLLSWTTVARLVRGQVLFLMEFRRKLVLADPGDYIPAVHHVDVRDLMDTRYRSGWLGLVLAGHGSGDRCDALVQHGLLQP